jgi:spore coat polysaccharide biosynthesis protein SpsF
MSEATRPRVVAIVQARMSSPRLPGKVMHPVAGQPLLWHVIHRLRRCRALDHIAIATTTAREDDAIAEFGRAHGVGVARGSEHNLLARYILAAWQTDAEIIVRVSADAPFVDPAFIDHLVETLIEKGGDYVVLEPGTACGHEGGVDPFTRRALEKLAREAARDAVAREHVSGYFKLNPDFVDVVHAPAVAALARLPARLTMDCEDDLAFAEAVHARLAANAGEASLQDLLWLIENDPHLRNRTAPEPADAAAVPSHH